MQRFASDVVAALDLIDDIILVLAPGADGPCVLDVNETFTRVAGHSAEAMRGRPFAALAGKHTLPETLAEIARSVAEIRGLRTEVALATSAGATFWLGFHMTPVLPLPGERGHFVLVGKDITERRRRSVADHAIQALLTGVFVSIDAAVAVTAADGQILAANPCLHALLGHPEGTMVGSHLRQHLAPEAAAADARANAEALARTGGQTAAQTTARDTARAGTQAGRSSARIMWQRRDGGTLAAQVTSAVIERPDLQRVRVLTVHPLDGPPADQPRLIGRAAHVGKLSVIGLQAIRDAYAGQWPAVRHRTLLLAEGIIKRRLAPGDTYTRTEDCAFVVWFADGTEEECALRGARIAREVRIGLLAELGDGAAAAVTSITERLTVSS